MGGGRAYFTPNANDDPETGKGRRLDGADLIEEWKTAHPNGSYVTNRDDLLSLDVTQKDSILGGYLT